MVVGPTAHSVTFSGLTNGAAYVVTLAARNGVGVGAVAAPSTTVVPLNPTRLVVAGPSVSHYGATSTLQAVLTRADTSVPVAGVPVAVATRPRGTSAWTSLATLTTDATGAVSQAVTADQNREVRFGYAGAVGMQPASYVQTLSVRRLLSLSVGPSSLYGRGTPVVAGVRVNLQRLSAGRWAVVAHTITGRYGWYGFRRPAAGTYRAVIAATSRFAKGFSAQAIAG
jgi:hypothetical protein